MQIRTVEISAERDEMSLNLSKRARVIMRRHSLGGATAWYREVLSLSTGGALATW